jgi:hypothetical protein
VICGRRRAITTLGGGAASRTAWSIRGAPAVNPERIDVECDREHRRPRQVGRGRARRRTATSTKPPLGRHRRTACTSRRVRRTLVEAATRVLRARLRLASRSSADGELRALSRRRFRDAASSGASTSGARTTCRRFSPRWTSSSCRPSGRLCPRAPGSDAAGCRARDAIRRIGSDRRSRGRAPGCAADSPARGRDRRAARSPTSGAARRARPREGTRPLRVEEMVRRTEDVYCASSPRAGSGSDRARSEEVLAAETRAARAAGEESRFRTRPSLASSEPCRRSLDVVPKSFRPCGRAWPIGGARTRDRRDRAVALEHRYEHESRGHEAAQAAEERPLVCTA